MKKTQDVIVLLTLFFLSVQSGIAQRKFVTPQASFMYKLAITKGADYFTKNFESDFKKEGYVADDDMIFVNVGQALLEDKKTDEAIAVMKYGADKFPEIIMLWNGLGEAYLDKGNKEAAKKCFQAVLKKRPDNPRAKEGMTRCN